MSVINQMLRDLDGRGKTLEAPDGSPAVHAGTHSVAYVPLPPPKPQKGRRPVVPLLLVLLVASGGLAWQQYGEGVLLSGSESVVAAPSASASPAPQASVPADAALVPQPALPASATVAAAVLALDAPVSLRIDAQLDHVPVRAATPTPTASVTAKEHNAPTVVPAAKVVLAPVEKPAAAPVLEKPVTPSVVESSGSAGQRQVAAVRDVLAQAQGLWAVGNHAGAVELLREALQSAEKSVQQPGMDSTLVAVVRELARMQLALGRVAEAHELLVHFEGRLKGIPEAWALRANAAQRLGQHQDSVQSYMLALQSRPTEQRWLLGLAVSLAAMGQTASAAEVVERARAEGPINREIAAYLRQMGVNMK